MKAYLSIVVSETSNDAESCLQEQLRISAPPAIPLTHFSVGEHQLMISDVVWDLVKCEVTYVCDLSQDEFFDDTSDCIGFMEELLDSPAWKSLVDDHEALQLMRN